MRVNGKKVRRAILEDENGEQWSVLLGYTVLESLWYEKNPRNGQIVTIEFTGNEVSKKGVPYKDFDLQAEEPKALEPPSAPDLTEADTRSGLREKTEDE